MTLARNILSWFLLALATSLLRFKIELQSDALFYDELATDLLLRGGAWNDWKFSAAPGFVPDMALYFIGFLVLAEVPSRILFVSVVQAFTFAGLALALARTVSPQADRNMHAHVVLAVAFATLISAQSGMWLYFHTTNNHFGTVLFGLLGTLLIVRLWHRWDYPTALGLVAVVGCATASSRLFLLNFTLPCLMLITCTLILQRGHAAGMRRRRKASLILGSLLAAGQVLALALEKVLIHHLPVEGRAPLSGAAIARSLKLFIEGGIAAFSGDNLATLLLSLVLTACLLYLGWQLLGWARLGLHGLRLRLAHASLAERNAIGVSALCGASLLLSCAGSILSGMIVDSAAYRYLAFPISLTVLLVITQAGRRPRPARSRHAPWLVAAVFIAGDTFHVARTASMPAEPAAAVAQCLNDAASTGFVPRAGIADYWNARAVTYHLPEHIPILSTIHNLTPLFWVSTIGPLKDRTRYPEYYYNFAILRNAGSQVQFSYTPQMVGRLLPPPSRVWSCTDGATQLWLYDGAELDNTMQAKISAFTQHLKLTP